MKVYARYSNGEFELTPIAADASGLNIFDMPDDKWEAYQKHQQACCKWHHYIGVMSGHYDKE